MSTVSAPYGLKPISLIGGQSFTGGTINIKKFGYLVVMEVNSATFGSTAVPTMSSAISSYFRPNFETATLVEYQSNYVAELRCTTAGIVSFTFRDWSGAGFAKTSFPGSYTLTWLKRG